MSVWRELWSGARRFDTNNGHYSCQSGGQGEHTPAVLTCLPGSICVGTAGDRVTTRHSNKNSQGPAADIRRAGQAPAAKIADMRHTALRTIRNVHGYPYHMSVCYRKAPGRQCL